MIAKHCRKRGGGIIKTEEKRPGVVAGVRQVEPQLLLLPLPLFATYHLVVISLCTSEASTCGCTAPSCPVRFVCRSVVPGRVLAGRSPAPWSGGAPSSAGSCCKSCSHRGSSSASTAMPGNAAPLLSANRAVRERRASSFEY